MSLPSPQNRQKIIDIVKYLQVLGERVAQQDDPQGWDAIGYALGLKNHFPAIAETLLALSAENEALKSTMRIAEEENKKLRDELEQAKAANEELSSCINEAANAAFEAGARGPR